MTKRCIDASIAVKLVLRSESHRKRELFGLAIPVLSLDGLIEAKKAAGRPKDQLHLLELEELKKLRGKADQGPRAGS